MKKIIIGVFVVGSIFLAYYLLGGTEKINITHESVNDYAIVGVDYNGRYRGKELSDIFIDVKNKLDSGQVKGVMVVINYNIDKDSLEAGYIHQFLGIQVERSVNVNLPRGYRLKIIKTTSAIKAQISAHNLVMPSPLKIESEIKAYAQTNTLTPMNLTIEKYVSQRELIIEVPIIN